MDLNQIDNILYVQDNIVPFDLIDGLAYFGDFGDSKDLKQNFGKQIGHSKELRFVIRDQVYSYVG